MIESYNFGQMNVGGVTYTSDLIIFVDHKKSNWRRIEGHKLHVADLGDVLRAKPDILVVGTGYYGLMEILPETSKRLQTDGIRLIAEKTGKAYKTYNELTKSSRTVGVFHLTC
jgi:hypothetical protein